MYFPYFRGKQYELIAIRECAEIFRDNGFIPIIEPVKAQLIGLDKTINTLFENDANAIVIANPKIGELKDSYDELNKLIERKYEEDKPITLGLLFDETTSFEDAKTFCNLYEDKNVAIIHSGFSHAKELAAEIAGNAKCTCSIFEDGKSGKLYQKHFQFHDKKILLKDGFEKRRNADHPPVEVFSDLHVTFELEGMNGFSDFLMVGDDYQEGGGPAYTIAIHLTYIDSDNDNIMYVRHFKSIRQDTPTDPAGKFAEALDGLITYLDSEQNKIYETSAIVELRELHAKGHYPGLGYLKKLSMKHHIETFATFFQLAEI